VKRRQFEEILDECISAYLSGRRSVEHSLSLYPSIARELEPLLRAAADTADTFQAMHPPPLVQARIRQRILRAANERAAARALTRGIDGFAESPATRSYWFVALPAVAAATAAVLVTGMLFLRDSSSDSSTGSASVTVIDRTRFASDLSDARRQLDVIRDKAARGQEVTPDDLEALLGATLRLGQNAEPEQLPATDQARVESMIEQQLVLLDQLSSETEDVEGIEDAVAATVSVAAVFGVAVPGSSPGAAPSPAATSGTGASDRTTSPASNSPGPSATASPLETAPN
jgi:hypothetical protein